MAENTGQFTKNDPRIGTKPKGALHVRTKFLDGLKANSSSERELIQKVLKMAAEGNTTALTITATRLWKESKSTLPAFQLPPAESKAETANNIIQAMTSGEIAADQALAAMSALRGNSELVEVAEILERLQRIEGK